MIRGFVRRRAKKRLAAAGADPRLLAYLDLDLAPDKRADLDDVRFVVLDCETTGLDPEHDRVISLSAVAVQDGAVHMHDRYETTIAGDSVGGHSAAPVHGLVTADLQSGLRESEAVLGFVEFLGDSVLVAHHAAFDTTVLSRALARLDAPGLENPVVDTGHLARRLEKGPVFDAPVPREARSLDALAARFGFDIPHRHSASGDALVTAFVLLALLPRARARGIHRLGDLLAR